MVIPEAFNGLEYGILFTERIKYINKASAVSGSTTKDLSEFG